MPAPPSSIAEATLVVPQDYLVIYNNEQLDGTDTQILHNKLTLESKLLNPDMVRPSL